MPLISTIRIGTIATDCSTGAPAARIMLSSPLTAAGCTSKKATFACAALLACFNWLSRLDCTRNTVQSRKVAKPSESMTTRVWFAGRCRFATPCRSVNAHRSRERRRASQLKSDALAQSTPTATKIPALIPTPSRTFPARRIASKTTVAPSSNSTESRGRSTRRRRGAEPGMLRRSTASGLTSRTASTGRSAKSVAVQTPIASPMSSARGSTCGVTSTGRKSAKMRGSSSCAPNPSAIPSNAPMTPSSDASSTYIIVTCPPVAPRHRSTATVSSRSAMYAWIALATPMPPSRSATSPTSPRNLFSCSIPCVRLRSVSRTVRARTFCASSSGFARATTRAGLSDAGSFTSASYCARLPNPMSRVSAR